MGVIVAGWGSRSKRGSLRWRPTNPRILEHDVNVEKLEKTEKEWAQLLTPAQFRVLRSEGTERCGTHGFNQEKRAGTFVCAGCYLPLFESKTKYESGTGWPSFWQPIAGALETKTDYHIGYARTEYHCARCGGHQGHVFDDGPRPTGLRYCNNGVALKFVAQPDKLPALRT